MGDGAATTSRGFCHLCECEVVPRDAGDGNFQCPLCEDCAVECPYDSFAEWQGCWHLTFDNGSENRLEISDTGLASLTVNGQTANAPLQWAPHEREGYLMRLQGHDPRDAGTFDLLGWEAGRTALRVRREHSMEAGLLSIGRGVRQLSTPAGPSAGTAQPQAGPPGQQELRQLVGNIMNAMMGGQPMAAQFQPEQGGDTNAAGGQQGPGLSPQMQEQMDRSVRQMQQSLAQFQARFNDPRMAEHLDQMRNWVEAAVGPPGPGGGHPEDIFSMAFQGFGVDIGQMFGPNMAQSQQRRAAVPERILGPWLDSHTSNSIELEPDWVCPICFDNAMKDLVIVCQASDRAPHVFHRGCIEDWLVRQNDCPSCRRSPVVEL